MSSNSNADYVEEEGLDDTAGVNKTTTTTGTTGGRRSHTCCFRLADTRKGVLLVDTLNVFAILISVLLNAVVYHERHFGGFFAGLLGVVLSTMGGYGALKFEYRLTAVATIGFFACFVVDFIFLNLIGIIIGAILVYPHAYFTYECYRGIMTKETYHRERYLMPGLPDVEIPDV